MTEGVFRPGTGFLYCLSPSLKLVFLLVLTVSLFSAPDLRRPLAIALLWSVLAPTAEGGFRDLWRVIRLLRWLLLFTMVLHLFFTPGRTLFGIAWLSYDGLMRGLLIDSQLILAVLFSLLLSWTTTPEALARGLEFLLAPLAYVRVPVRETTGLLLLVLYFFPLIREEIDGQRVHLSGARFKGVAMLKAWVARFEPLLVRLFDRADELALEIVSGKRNLSFENDSIHLFSRADVIGLGFGVATLLLIWQV